ncbi:MAG: thioredoxin-dependent thiol peroxidase [Bacteroidales bacterium]|nr:thioredoxin-dependent thiol peroxidase [Bacteroidales bacterium]
MKAGDPAPDFQAMDQSSRQIALASLQGKKVILFFYPKADTPGCTAEACNLRDHYSELLQKGFEIIGVSADDTQKQKKFTEKYQLPFPLLADTEKTVIRAYGAWGPKQFMGKKFDGIHRMTFVISEEGIIEKVFDKVETKSHAEQILKEYP